MILSSAENRTVDLPLDGDYYEAWLNTRIAESKLKPVDRTALI